MKKLTAIILVLTMLFALTACGSSSTLKGAYKSDEGFLSQTWTFSGSNEVTLSAGGGLVSTQGTYTIKDGKMYVTSALLGQENTTSYSFQCDGKNIVISGTVFYKQ